MASQPVVPPTGQFPEPVTSEDLLLAFRCSPAIKPYLAEDSTGSVIIDSLITNRKIEGAVTINRHTETSSPLSVTISLNGKILATSSVTFNSTGQRISFPLNAFLPKFESYNVTCSASAAGGQKFQAYTQFQRLPNPASGSVTKMDLQTGAMLVKNGSELWEPVFSLGFYTNFGGYLASNLSLLDELKDQGYALF